MLQAAAGNAGGAGLDVDEVFSTYLYDGNGSTQTITNGIDLAGEGGLVWIKQRDGSAIHGLVDTERGRTVYLDTNSVRANRTTNGPTYDLTSFNSDGFSLGQNWELYGNNNGNTYASWTFRKAPKFFDVVTYTGNGVAGRTVGHSLNSAVGCIIVKATNNSRSWAVYHRGADSTAPEDYGLYLNETTDRSDDAQLWNDTAPTSTEFTVGTDGDTNVSGRTYVAYLFAHNDGDGEFGPNGSDIIKCGSYSGTGNYQEIDLGFEAQWVMIKRTDSSQDWMIFDVMRGMPDQGGTGSPPSGNDARLKPNTSDAEQSDTYGIDPHANGFAVRGNNISVNGSTYIYIAIRRGPLAPPESATEVFAVSDRKNEIPSFPSGFPVDFLIGPRTIDGTDNNEVKTRLISGGYLRTNTTGAENASSQVANFAHNDGFFNFSGANASQYSWMWKRAPNFFDVVAFDGGGAGDVVNHNLGVKPDLMMYKRRSATNDWIVYNSIDGANYAMFLNKTDARESQIQWWNNTEPTATNFTTGSKAFSGSTYIAYLFASLDGISKVGSVTQSGTTNVDCGFTSGARFVLLKRTDASGDWYFWDSERGIVSGNDPYLLLNSSAAQVAVQDYINPLSSGFTITSNFDFGDYIFYAIA